MGIDIYAQWKGQKREEASKQAKSWSCSTAGSCGYLREAYHGEPYATRYLCAEAFERGEARIPAAQLLERLPHTLTLVAERERSLYKSGEDEIKDVAQSYRDFVALCERKEKETGEQVLIIASY